MLRRPAIAAVVFLLTGLAIGLASPASAAPAKTTALAAPKAAAATGPTTGFVRRSGTQLAVNGQPWRFAGYNLPCAQPFTLNASQLNYYLDNIQLNSSANAVRVWFFQSNGGPTNWAPFDNVLSALKSRGMRAIPTLTNEWNTCEPNVSSQKLLSWYQTGYKQTGDGYPLSFRSFAQQIAAHYANEPTVAFWQLVNEAEAPSVNASGVNFCDSTAPNGLRSFSDDMATVLHQADPNHLVNLGTIGSGQCGLDGASYNYVHGGALDLCEYHDYGSAAQAVPSNGTNLLKERIDGCHALGKPIFVGEAGIAGNVQPNGAEQACLPWPNCGPYAVNAQTFQQRATFFQAKTQGGNTAGLVGYLIWFKSPYYSSSTDAMAIGDGDPTESTLAYALQPGSPAPSVPESPWPILLVITGTVAAAGVIALSVRRARRHVSAASA